MNTLRVNICYRPLRIGWLIRGDDLDAFQKVVLISHALWGGRFNPFIVIDREEEARRLIDLYRVDLLMPSNAGEDLTEFSKRFPHLIKPFYGDHLFLSSGKERKRAQVLDVQNSLVYLRGKPEWDATRERGVRIYSWDASDPLAHVFSIQLGAYPDPTQTGVDYRGFLANMAEATDHTLEADRPISAKLVSFPTISNISRLGTKEHYSVDNPWNHAGFFAGSAACFDDLVTHWNLRAANIALWFIDRDHLSRYSEIVPAFDKMVREMPGGRRSWNRDTAVWSRRPDDLEQVCKAFGDIRLSRCHVFDALWNGKNLRAPMMYFGETSVLGVMAHEDGKPRVSFAFSDKPFSADNHFAMQKLVASLELSGGLHEDEQHTLDPPYVPELNEFYSRSMHFDYKKLRVEPGRIGLVMGATDHDSFLHALPVADLMERIFDIGGFSSSLSSGGLITRQVISRLGGVDGARPLKIPGVRRLLKTYGPAAAFTKSAALQLIGSKDPENPSQFSDYHDLFIEPRPTETKLTPKDVFTYLVDKGLFRIGTQLTCPNCRMTSWTALDVLKQKVVCELCGSEHDSTRQLINGEWYYRRTGILGTEKNAQGAVPVILTLQQLHINLERALEKSVYSPSLDLTPKADKTLPRCEIDFVWLIPRQYPRKPVVILGECKDQWAIDKDDLNNLRRVADALPRKRFKTFILLSKLTPFTPEEIRLASTLCDKHRQRAILLTARELEPYHIFERTKLIVPEIDEFGGSPEALAEATAKIYFTESTGRSSAEKENNGSSIVTD
jgi:hypothetical protein